MNVAHGGSRITAAIVVVVGCVACASHPAAAPEAHDPSSAVTRSASVASASVTPSAASRTPTPAPAPIAAAVSETSTSADPAGFDDSRIVPCPATNTCLFPTQGQANSLVLYSAETGKVVRPVADASDADVGLQALGSDYDSQWTYYVQQSGQVGGAPPAVNALMRVPAAGGQPQVVAPNLLQPSPFQNADNYVVSADGSKVAYLFGGDADSLMVATLGSHPAYTSIDVPASDSMLHLAGWLPDDKTVVAVLPSDDATPGSLVEFDTTAPFGLKVIFTPPRPRPYSHDECPDVELAAAVAGDTIALAVGDCRAETVQVPAPQVYFVDAAGNHGSPIEVAQTPYLGGFTVAEVQFASDDEVVVDLGHQDCYGPGVWVAVTKAGDSHYVPVQGDGCGG